MAEDMAHRLQEWVKKNITPEIKPTNLENSNNGDVLHELPSQINPKTNFLGPKEVEPQSPDMEYRAEIFLPNLNLQMPAEPEDLSFTTSLPPTQPTTSLKTLQELYQQQYYQTQTYQYNNCSSTEQFPQISTDSLPMIYTPYACRGCERQYETFDGMALHQELHLHTHADDVRDRRYLCEKCGRTFPTLRILEIHLNDHIHTGMEQFSCPVCPEIFAKRENIIAHLDAHLSGDSQTTRKRKSSTTSGDDDDCPERSSNKIKLTLTTETGEFRCSKCNSCFSLERSFQIHKESCSKNNPIKCKGCDKVFQTSTDMALHVQLNNKGNIFHTCEKCDEIFYHPSTLKEHMKTHIHVDKKNRYTCPICPEKYSEADDLIQHLDEHQELQKHNCEHCEVSFDYKSQFNEHLLKIHGQDPPRPYGCSLCDKRFTEIKVLRCHETQAHSKVKICEVCQKIFNLQRELTVHMKSEHRTRKPFKFTCHKCLEIFYSKKELNQHENIHLESREFPCGSEASASASASVTKQNFENQTGEQPAISTCKHCQKCFTSKLLLEQHLESRNRGESNVCVDCQLEFCTKSQLDVHLQIHTIETPHICEHCGMYFPRRSVLDYHLKNNSVKHPVICLYCPCSFMWKCARIAHLRVVHAGDLIPSSVTEYKYKPNSVRLILPTKQTPEIIDLTSDP